MREILKFTSPTCGPCKTLGQVFANMGSFTLPEIIEVDISADDEGLAEIYEVRSVPTLVLLEDDEEIARKIGIKGISTPLELYQWINQ